MFRILTTLICLLFVSLAEAKSEKTFEVIEFTPAIVKENPQLRPLQDFDRGFKKYLIMLEGVHKDEEVKIFMGRPARLKFPVKVSEGRLIESQWINRNDVNTFVFSVSQMGFAPGEKINLAFFDQSNNVLGVATFTPVPLQSVDQKGNVHCFSRTDRCITNKLHDFASRHGKRRKNYDGIEINV